MNEVPRCPSSIMVMRWCVLTSHFRCDSRLQANPNATNLLPPSPNAGALVTEGTEVPPRSLILGVPAKVKRELTEAEIGMISEAARHYAEVAMVYKEGGFEEQTRNSKL